MKAITCWQPWASLIAEGVKTIETRPRQHPWRSAIGETIAIHASARKPKRETLGEWQCDPAYTTERYVPPEPRIWRSLTKPGDLFGSSESRALPLGAVVATCRLVDVVPMVHAGNEGAIRTLDIDADDSLWIVEPQGYPQIAEIPADLRSEYLNLHDAHEGVDPARWEEFCDEHGLAYDLMQHEVSSQRPFGNFAPGRWALLLDQVIKQRPVPCRGYQGLWTLPDEVVDQLIGLAA